MNDYLEDAESSAKSTVWRLRGSAANDLRDCLATDWGGLLLAHTITGDLGVALTRAIEAGQQLPEVRLAHPELVVDPVTVDLSHEPFSPVRAKMPDGTTRRCVLSLDPFSRGFWQVETASGSKHILDLCGGAYRRISDTEVEDVDAGWYGIESIAEWPAVNSTFTIQLLPNNLPENAESLDEPSLRALFDAAPFLTTSWVTRIVQLTEDEADADGVQDLAPVSDFDVLCATPPRNAWLFMASDDSPIDVETMNEGGGGLWTSPKHVQRGDLALFYYVSPHRALLYAARVASQPVYAAPDVDADSKDKWPNQWWSWVDAFVKLDPVPLTALTEYFGGHLVMRGKSGHYVPPWVVTQIMLNQRPEPAKDLVVQVPTASPDLPEDEDVPTLEQWTALASGAFQRELDVEHYLVEPLLNWLIDSDPDRSWTGKAPLGKLVPDYSLYAGSTRTAVVEVKLGIRGIQRGNNWVGPDLDQLRKYCAIAGVPGLLVDSNRIIAFEADTAEPVALYERSRLTPADLARIRRHLFPATAPRGSG
jgi:hypothetical protein